MDNNSIPKESQDTSIKVKRDTKVKLKEIKKYPRETDDETINRLINGEVNNG